jgi:hypothetical protein
LFKKGIFISLNTLWNFVVEVIKLDLGTNWPRRFLKKHKDKLIFTYITRINASQKRANSALNYSKYFKLLVEKIKKYNL